jgi:hypothetical protein
MDLKAQKLDGYDPVAEGEQDRNGVDLLALRQNRSLSPAERLRLHDARCRFLIKIHNARRAA